MEIPRISQPLPIEPKRVFTLNIDSNDRERQGDIPFTFYTTAQQTVVPNINPEVFTGDLYYRVPVPLESKSGFFNVSVKSFSVECRFNNQIPNPGTGYDIDYPQFAADNISINMEVSSPYTFKTETKNNIPFRTTLATALTSSSNIYRKYPLLQIGKVNVVESAPAQLTSFALSAVAPPAGPSVAAIGSPVLPQGKIITIDNYKCTIVNQDPTIIHIVLGSLCLDGDSFPYNSATCLVPLNQPDLLTGGVTGSAIPFCFRYNLVLQFEEV